MKSISEGVRSAAGFRLSSSARSCALVPRERVELHEQRRHEVECDLHAGKLTEQRHHPVVVLDRVQADPREDVLSRYEVLIERLVHVPEDGDASHTV